jgi:hypothetical protein
MTKPGSMHAGWVHGVGGLEAAGSPPAIMAMMAALSPVAWIRCPVGRGQVMVVSLWCLSGAHGVSMCGGVSVPSI